MSDYNPGPGWREVGYPLLQGKERIIWTPPGVDPYSLTRDNDRVWVREEPVPPLPTEPYTVIRATRRNGQTLVIWLASGSGIGALWLDSEDNPVATAGITSFEVLSEPRAVIAKAVLDRLSEFGIVHHGATYQDIAREFGVES